jgi:hypothetical protein
VKTIEAELEKAMFEAGFIKADNYGDIRKVGLPLPTTPA